MRGPAAVAAKVNDVIKLITGTDSTFTDPRLAGRWLGGLLDSEPSRLLVLDDVWELEQLAPFTDGGAGCVRLVTTRVPGLLTGRGAAVRVDKMTSAQARVLLTAGLPPLDGVVVGGLLAVTGQWPLLLRLVNRVLADYAQVSGDVAAQAAVLLERLRRDGPQAVDGFLGDAGRGLDINQPEQRAQAVRATIEPVLACWQATTQAGSPSWVCSPRTRSSRSPWQPGCGGKPPGWMSCRPRGCANGWRSSP